MEKAFVCGGLALVSVALGIGLFIEQGIIGRQNGKIRVKNACLYGGVVCILIACVLNTVMIHPLFLKDLAGAGGEWFFAFLVGTLLTVVESMICLVLSGGGDTRPF